MVCCYQVTKICGSRYGFANASSTRNTCNFVPFTDLAISIFRKMNMNIVLTQIVTSFCNRPLLVISSPSRADISTAASEEGEVEEDDEE